MSLVEVWCGSRKHGLWRDAFYVLELSIADWLYERARDMDDALFDTVSVEVEDRRAEAASHAAELRIDAADARGHAHRDKIAERRMG